MTKGAAEVAASSLDEDMATAEALLRSQTFQQRLDQARAARELALQARTPDELSAATLSKPWEKAPARHRDGGEPAARRLERAAPTLFFPAGSAPASVANSAQPAAERMTDPPISPDASPQQQKRSALPKSGLLRTAIGFSLGLGVGLAVAFFAVQRPALPSQTLTTTATTAPATQPVASAGPYLPENLLGGSVQADDPVTTPAAIEDRPKTLLSDTPVTLAPEMAPLQNLTIAQSAPIVWWPEASVLSPLTAEPALTVLPGDGGPVGAILPPGAIGTAAAPETAPNYGPEPRTPPSAGPATRYPGLSVRVLSAMASDTPDIAQLTAALTNAGFPLADVGQVSYTIRQTHVRYYHGAEAPAAKAIAAELGAEARDFSQDAANAPEGLVEIWVAPAATELAQVPSPSEPAAASALTKAPAKSKPAAKKQPKAVVKTDTQAAEAAEAAAVKARILLMLQGSATP